MLKAFAEITTKMEASGTGMKDSAIFSELQTLCAGLEYNIKRLRFFEKEKHVTDNYIKEVQGMARAIEAVKKDVEEIIGREKNRITLSDEPETD